MDEKAQTEGEKRVEAVLIAPLLALGLAKPSTATNAAFENQKKELRQKLAYMSEAGLISLREWIEAHPGGKEKDRFPIPLKILPEAHRIQEPETGPSPLMLKVFGHAMGREAIEKGWAPELLKYLKAAREWPQAYSQTLIKRKADNPVRRLEDIELRMSRNDPISSEDEAFRNHRLAALRKCKDIADQARTGRAA